MPAVANIRDFFELLKKSNLLSKQQLMSAREAVRDFTEARGLAKWLLKRDLVTPWQAMQLLSGHHRLFLGKYKLLDVIGQGGMGAVLKAEQSSIKRMVALKVMAKELVRDEKAVSRFLREIQSAASLNHPHIVAAIDADCIGDRYFLVMDYVEGRDLKAWLKKYGPLPVSWSCEVIRQVALGLQHAHELGLVHRDIKPSNIMVTVNHGLRPLEAGQRNKSRRALDADRHDHGLAGLHRAGTSSQRKRSRHPGRLVQSGLHSVPTADGAASVPRWHDHGKTDGPRDACPAIGFVSESRRATGRERDRFPVAAAQPERTDSDSRRVGSAARIVGHE